MQFAEHVDAATERNGIVMLDVEEVDADKHVAGMEIGWITLGLTVPDTRAPRGYWGTRAEQDPGPHCFRVAFDNWGVDGIDGVGCPDEFVAVPPPPSKRPRVAVNAEEAVWSVLTAVRDELPAEVDVVAAVEALLEPHPNGVTPLAEVTSSAEGQHGIRRSAAAALSASSARPRACREGGRDGHQMLRRPPRIGGPRSRPRARRSNRRCTARIAD